jgi:hypothetical protein
MASESHHPISDGRWKDPFDRILEGSLLKRSIADLCLRSNEGLLTHARISAACNAVHRSGDRRMFALVSATRPGIAKAWWAFITAVATACSVPEIVSAMARPSSPRSAGIPSRSSHSQDEGVRQPVTSAVGTTAPATCRAITAVIVLPFTTTRLDRGADR